MTPQQPAGFPSTRQRCFRQARWEDEAMGNDHWHTLEGMRSCPDKCVAPEVIDALEARLTVQSEKAGHNLHLIRSHAWGPPCHCREVGGGSLTYRGHVKPCAICDAWHASPKGQAQAAYLAREYPFGDAARRRTSGAPDAAEERHKDNTGEWS